MMLSNSNLTISTKRAYNSLMNFCNIVNYIYIYIFFFFGVKNTIYHYNIYKFMY